MASEHSDLNGELLALCRAMVESERRRDERLEAKLAELNSWMAEASRVQQLITGGASNREARLRALEDRSRRWPRSAHGR